MDSNLIPQNSNEIDLQKIAVAVIKFVKRNFLFLILSALAGAILSLLLYTTPVKTYEARMVVFSNMFNEPYFQPIIYSLDGNVVNHFNLTMPQAHQLISINSEIKDQTLNAIATVTDTVILQKVQTGIIKLLQSHPLVKSRARQHKEMIEATNAKIDATIQSLDSLKKKLLADRHHSSGIKWSDITNIFMQKLDLQKQKLKNDNTLETFESIQLVEGFSIHEKTVPSNHFRRLVEGFIVGLLGALAVLVILKSNKLARA